MDEEIHSAHSVPFSGAPGGATSTFLSHLVSSVDTISRATSPGLVCPDGRSVDEDDKKRYRPRTFSYFQLMPFDVEEEAQRDDALTGILKNLYITLKAEDFAPGALHWTRELQGWLNLKFEMTRELRARLARLYYHLSLAPGLDGNTADRFARMVISLTKKKHYLKPGEDLVLDWRPLWHEIKVVVLPSEGAPHQSGRRRLTKHLLRLAMHANSYFDPLERQAMIEEIMPFFTTSELSHAFIVIGALNIMLPTAPAPRTEPLSQPADFLPTFFHLWSLMSRSKTADVAFIDLFSRLARDFLGHEDVSFSEYGLFTKEQSDLIWTAILRLTDIPVGQATSPYSTLDYNSGWGGFLEKDKKKYPVPFMIARWIVNTMSPLCLASPDAVLSNLEGLMQSVDTFFHPSNQGAWTGFLAQLTFYLADLFVSRWNREQSGELDVPENRRLTPEVKARFVLALREVTFVGLFAKSSKVISYYYSTLQSLTYLEPDLMLPGALQRFYPSLQGLVEVHRTMSSLGGLQMIANIMCREKGFRCHVLALLALALPGIDANDLNKTQYTLHFIQTVAYSIPFVPLVRDDDHVHDTSIAMAWVQGEVERMEREGQDIKINYKAELTDEDEADILRSSTAGLGEFVLALLGEVFTLLENLPDANTLKSGSPEENVINTLPAALTPLFASLSPDLFDMVLDKLINFVSSHVVHQARDAMAWICSALCKVNPEKTLKAFIPMLIINIRNEIDCNGAASDRSSGTEILPRDRALVWHVSMLSMCVVHVGAAVLKYKTDLLQIAAHMQQNCRGLPTIHISNYIHHLLLNLSSTYPVDNALYEPDVVERGLNADDWGRTTAPSALTIRWHRPSSAEILFAVELFESQAKGAAKRLVQLMSDDPPVRRKGKNKEWSDELSRSLTAIRLAVSGISTLFDPQRSSEDPEALTNSANGAGAKAGGDGDAVMEMDDDPLADVADDDEFIRHIRYPAGYVLDQQDPTYTRIHHLRDDIGRLLSRTHRFLNSHQQDDVGCFTSLYAACRTWMTDMGIERSAHPVERLTRFYKSEISPFKISGLRKSYPRPLLIRRADAYQLQRVKYNAMYRKRSDIDKRLLLDLAESSTSLYSDVRRVAQGAQDSSLKVLVGNRTLVIPVVMAALRKALDETDHDRIKGAIYTLLFTGLIRTLMRDWRFAPDLMRLYLETAAVDKASIQALTASAMFQLGEFGKKFESMAIYDADVFETIKPTSDHDDCSAAIQRRHNFIVERRAKVEEKKAALGLELIKKSEGAHWKMATICSIFALNLSLRFDTIAKPDFVALVTKGVNDQHPGLRTNYQAAFSSLCTAVQVRALYQHEYRNFLLEKDHGDPNKIKVQVPAADPQLTGKFLAQFGKMDGVDYFVDSDFPGWLVWGKSYTAFSAKPTGFYDYDAVESAARNQIGALLTKDWMKKLFGYMKQEPRDEGMDRFRMQNVVLLIHAFNLMNDGVTSIKFDDVVELTREIFGDGSDKHQHRATAEIVGALMTASANEPLEVRNQSWGFAAPLMLKVIADDLTPDNLQYWMTCMHLVAGSKDPRRAHEIVHAMADFRLDMSSNAAFKESSKVLLLEFVVNDAGWHFQLEKPILADFLAHLDHPYKSVREAVGRAIATIYRTRYHESFPGVAALLEQNREASSIGLRTYVPTADFAETIREVFARLEQWRKGRPPGLQTPCSYTSGSKTVLVWLDAMLSSQECTQLVPFFSEPLLEQLLHMMDVKEDPELMKLAYHVYRHLANIPLWSWRKPRATTELDQSSAEEDAEGQLEEGADTHDYADTFIRALIRIGAKATSWHQRLRSLVNMQVVYFRRLFMTTESQRKLLFQGVRDMLADPQLEVRDTAASTLAGMIRCSPIALREPIIAECKAAFEAQLKANPMPKRKLAILRRVGSQEKARSAVAAAAAGASYLGGKGTGNGNGSNGEASGAATPTSTMSASNGPEYEKQQRIVLLRHAAVLGLGALVEAFPYATPPPMWMPEVLACLATGPASDAGVVGKAAKQVLAEFKKTRQDSWGVDQKYFTSEQLEDLEGVMWKSYFA